MMRHEINQSLYNERGGALERIKSESFEILHGR